MTYAVLGTPEYKFGDTSRLYGLPTEDTTHWSCEVDWDGDGVYTGDSENAYMIGFTSRRGRNAFLEINGDGVASGFEPVRVGTASVTLDNSSRRFDPYNTASPLYPNVQPGRYIRIKTSYLGTEYPIIHGKITNISVEDTDAEQTVTLEIEDGLRLLQNTDVYIPLQEDIYFDDAIQMVLDDAGWPTLYGSFLSGHSSGLMIENIPYWSVEGKAIDAIRAICQACVYSNFFVAADGMAKYYGIGYGITPVLTASAADFLRDTVSPFPQDVIRNYIKYYAHPITEQASGDLWTMQDAPLIGAGDTVDIWAQYYYNDQPVQAKSVIAPVITTDYLMNAAADGSGADVSTDYTVAFTEFGRTGKIRVTNNSATDSYITLLKVRGVALTQTNASFLLYEDAASQASNGKLQLVVDNKFIQNTTGRIDFVLSLVLADFISNKRYVSVSLEGRPDIQFTPDLIDPITLTIEKYGISSARYLVSSIEHEWLNENGNAVRTNWNLEPLFFST